jgi:hypothetical protein
MFYFTFSSANAIYLLFQLEIIIFWRKCSLKAKRISFIIILIAFSSRNTLEWGHWKKEVGLEF